MRPPDEMIDELVGIIYTGLFLDLLLFNTFLDRLVHIRLVPLSPMLLPITVHVSDCFAVM
jgi:hypothetical protein